MRSSKVSEVAETSPSALLRAMNRVEWLAYVCDFVKPMQILSVSWVFSVYSACPVEFLPREIPKGYFTGGEESLTE
jgi:hypothetical protein